MRLADLPRRCSLELRQHSPSPIPRLPAPEVLETETGGYSNLVDAEDKCHDDDGAESAFATEAAGIGMGALLLGLLSGFCRSAGCMEIIGLQVRSNRL